jgi:hypothetical protein
MKKELEDMKEEREVIHMLKERNIKTGLRVFMNAKEQVECRKSKLLTALKSEIDKIFDDQNIYSKQEIEITTMSNNNEISL